MAPKSVRTVLSVLFFVFLMAMWVCAFTICAPLTLLLLPFVSRHRRQNIVGRVWRSFNVFLISPLWGLKVIGCETKDSKRTIFMINHASNCDPFLAASALYPWECKWICKGSLMKVPFGGWCLSLAGDLAVHFTKEKDGWGTKKGSVSSMMSEAASLLREDYPIAVFPEGVRTNDPFGPLQTFKPGFFDLAMKEGARISPVVITNSHEAWGVHDWRVNPVTCYCKIGKPIEASTYDSVEKLIADVHAVMTRMRSETFSYSRAKLKA